MKQLWTELYRPTKITDYVFRDNKQRSQVEGWVKSGAIPHLLFSGAAGTGKCIGADELIDVDIDTSRLTKAQRKILSKYM